MKNLLLMVLLSLLTLPSLAQPLDFGYLEMAPAFCRTEAAQSGNGVIWLLGGGGTPPYVTQMTNISTGVTSPNSTWGGLNPGLYELKIWDSAGDSVYQTVMLDSINPEAVLSVTSDGLSPQGNDLFWGEAGVQVEFESNSTGVYNSQDPNADTSVFWQMTQFEIWTEAFVTSTMNYTYNYGGTWAASLVAVNSNGCSDTAKAHIWLNGTVGLQELETENTAWLSDNQIQVQMQNERDYNLLLLDLNGKLIKEEKFSGKSISTDFNSTKGMYLVMIKAEGEVKFIQKLVVN